MREIRRKAKVQGKKEPKRKKLPIATSIISKFTRFSLILFVNQVCIAAHLTKSDSEWYMIIK